MLPSSHSSLPKKEEKKKIQRYFQWYFNSKEKKWRPRESSRHSIHFELFFRFFFRYLCIFPVCLFLFLFCATRSISTKRIKRRWVDSNPVGNAIKETKKCFLAISTCISPSFLFFFTILNSLYCYIVLHTYWWTSLRSFTSSVTHRTLPIDLPIRTHIHTPTHEGTVYPEVPQTFFLLFFFSTSIPVLGSFFLVWQYLFSCWDFIFFWPLLFIPLIVFFLPTAFHLHGIASVRYSVPSFLTSYLVLLFSSHLYSINISTSSCSGSSSSSNT